jgi:hypothetical protein
MRSDPSGSARRPISCGNLLKARTFLFIGFPGPGGRHFVL